VIHLGRKKTSRVSGITSWQIGGDLEIRVDKIRLLEIIQTL